MTEIAVKIKATHTTLESVSLEFPRYARHDYDGDTWSVTHYTRLNADGSYVDIQRNRDGWELEKKTVPLNSPLGWPIDTYYLGLDGDKSSADEFGKALAELREFVASI